MNFRRWAHSIQKSQRGWTLIELMVVIAIMGMVTPGITLLYLKMTQGMAGDEMRGQLQTANTNTLLRIRDRLLSNRHFFFSDSSGTSFIADINFSSTAPPVLTGSHPASLQAGSSFSPGTAVAADFGNCLFMGINDSTQTITFNSATTAFYAPLTVAGTNITWSTPVPTPVGFSPTPVPAMLTIDVYRFYYYYLTTTNPKSIANATTYRLVEWRSQQFADYYEISAIPDAALQKSVIAWIASSASVTTGSQPITLAWDPTQSAVTQAFYDLSAAGVATAAPSQKILESDWSYMTHVTSGILTTGFNYGVASNNPPWSNVPGVPLYATLSGAYPGGFEVGVEGPVDGREILIRSLLVAKGASISTVYNDMTTINAARDVW